MLLYAPESDKMEEVALYQKNCVSETEATFFSALERVEAEPWDKMALDQGGDGPA